MPALTTSMAYAYQRGERSSLGVNCGQGYGVSQPQKVQRAAIA
jgi:hypothetical protein